MPGDFTSIQQRIFQIPAQDVGGKTLQLFQVAAVPGVGQLLLGCFQLPGGLLGCVEAVPVGVQGFFRALDGVFFLFQLLGQILAHLAGRAGAGDAVVQQLLVLADVGLGGIVGRLQDGQAAGLFLGGAAGIDKAVAQAGHGLFGLVGQSLGLLGGLGARGGEGVQGGGPVHGGLGCFLCGLFGVVGRDGFPVHRAVGVGLSLKGLGLFASLNFFQLFGRLGVAVFGLSFQPFRIIADVVFVGAGGDAAPQVGGGIGQVCQQARAVVVHLLDGGVDHVPEGLALGVGNGERPR